MTAILFSLRRTVRNTNFSQKIWGNLSLWAFLLLASPYLWAGDYEDAWAALNRNDRASARQLFTKALNDPAHAGDAAIMLFKLNAFENQGDKLDENWTRARKLLSNPYPYIYALWFHEGVMGSFGYKDAKDQKKLKELMDDPACPEQLKAAAKYMMGMAYLADSEPDKRKEIWNGITKMDNWQYTGPFDNLGGSGFDKNYPPIAEPQPSARFKSERNSDIWWHSPARQSNCGWTFPANHIPSASVISFAQTFLTSDFDTDALLGIGFDGNLKVWVNDRLVFAEQEIRESDFDAYTVPCKLRKGVNRVLVQVGTENSSTPTFALRFTDPKGRELPGISTSTTYAPYTKDSDGSMPAVLPHFAEEFFKKKIEAEPNNLLNYILLNEAYLRTRKAQDAFPLIEKALSMAPDNSLLRIELITCLSILENETDQSKEVQHIKEHDPDCHYALERRIAEELENERYEEAQKLLQQVVNLYGKSPYTYHIQIALYSRQDKIEDLVNTISIAYERYPQNVRFCELAHNIELHLRKNTYGAMGVYKKYLEKNYNLSVADDLTAEQIEAGQNNAAIKTMKYHIELYPYSGSHYEELFDYYLDTRDFDEAQELMTTMLDLAPFYSRYYSKAAELARQRKKDEVALNHFQKAVHYNPNDFETRRKIREMQNKPELSSYFPTYDVYDLIKKSKKPSETEDFGYYTVLDERCTILHPERCSETIFSLSYRILTEKGIEALKEYSIPYNSWKQKLVVEKAEVVKANGSKLDAEQSGNEFVFPKLEIGDAIYLKYRITSYATGRMSREFWDSHYFNSFVHTDLTRYCIMVANNINIDIQTKNFDVQPTVETVENFKLYMWENRNEPPLKSENNMPVFQDIGKMLYISTIPDWKEVSTWYTDVASTQAKADYEVKKVLKGILPAGQNFTDEEKARKIYEYVVKNIQYSSVSFRQSAYTPQRAAKTIQTRLGDCKDVSTLFATLAREAGLKAHLVLVNTRDNGEATMPLPSIEFNHCIVKAYVGEEPLFLELTDRNLPFGSLPSFDLGAQALEIPHNGGGGTSAAKLFKLFPGKRTRDYSHNSSGVSVKNKDLMVQAKLTASGVGAGTLRYNYSTLSAEKRKEELQDRVSSMFTNQVSVKEIGFGDLSGNGDTLQYLVNYQVKNEVIEIGDLKTFKTPWFYQYIEADHFPEETRQFPINYWNYEEKDEYIEELTIILPDNASFSDLPKDVSLSFKGSQYSIKYEKLAGNKVRVVRNIQIERGVIPAEDYPAFRQYLDDTLAAESKYLAFK